MILQILFVLLAPQTLFAQWDCQLDKSNRAAQLLCPTLMVEQTRDSSGQEQSMTVLFNDGMSMTLSIYTTPYGTNTLFELDLANRETAQLTTMDYEQLQMAVDWIYGHSLFQDFILIGFFANLPSEESLAPLTIASGEVPWPSDDGDQIKPNIKKKK